MQKIQTRPEINLIVVGDHGLADVPDTDHFRYLSDYVPGEMLQRVIPRCSTYCKLTPSENYTTFDVLEKLKPLLEETGWRYYK